ncbi:transcriptional regulator [Solibacillus sp. R5-41]|uniref:helix-turn-helix transcriptional regulator n=1 Tax=Solibacillus sp. R5-41 TaxID=2048654 RepID=UPI000C126FA2|nr:helix-turn-helix domain-containing protein [Solibacillus sp. R5-41]ATP41055.1 transcriptional regulator [Solibacillus sp. R5-41]
MIHPIKITSTLADETRFSIYEYMLQHKKHFTVQNIAEEFKIHSNVARLHLTKLAEIGAISSEYLKTGKGGRPGRVYKIKQDGISLSFPRRDPSLLLNWSLDLIAELGDVALEKAKQLSYEDGKQFIHELLIERKHRLPLPFDEKVKLLTNSAQLIGYIPEVTENEGVKTLIFSIYNCPFHDQITRHGEIVCTLHESYLRGQVEMLFETEVFSQFESMLNSCDFCNYKIAIQK